MPCAQRMIKMKIRIMNVIKSKIKT
jgi:hypothetical protein